LRLLQELEQLSVLNEIEVCSHVCLD